MQGSLRGHVYDVAKVSEKKSQEAKALAHGLEEDAEALTTMIESLENDQKANGAHNNGEASWRLQTASFGLSNSAAFVARIADILHGYSRNLTSSQTLSSVPKRAGNVDSEAKNVLDKGFALVRAQEMIHGRIRKLESFRAALHAYGINSSSIDQLVEDALKQANGALGLLEGVVVPIDRDGTGLIPRIA